MKKEFLIGTCIAMLFLGCGSSSSSTEGGENESDDNTAYHNQGESCLSCHQAPASAAEGNSFYSGATAYTALDASSSSQYGAEYTLQAVLSNGQIVTFSTGRGSGNFNSTDSRLLSYTFTARLLDRDGVVVSSSAVNSHSSGRLDCNTCHTASGNNGAPGRIAPVTQTTSTTPPPTQNQLLSFSTDVMPILESNCKSCHGSNGRFSVTTPSATYTNIEGFNGIDTQTPDNSLLLTKAAGINHGGGVILSVTGSDYGTLKEWIVQGALNN